MTNRETAGTTNPTGTEENAPYSLADLPEADASEPPPGGGAASPAPPAAKKLSAKDKTRELLADDPTISIQDVLSVLIHDHFIADEPVARKSASRNFYKIRSEKRAGGPKSTKPKAAEPIPRAGRPATKAPPKVPAKAAPKPPTPVPTKAVAPPPPAGTALGRAAAGARAAEADGVDDDVLEPVRLAKRTLVAMAAPNLSPEDLVLHAAELTERVGGAANLRRVLGVMSELETIRRDTRRVTGAAPAKPVTAG